MNSWKQIFSTVLRFWFLVFVLPLLGRVEQLLHPALLGLMILWSLGLMHQTFRTAPAPESKTDFSQGIISLFTYIVTVTTIVNFAYAPTPAPVNLHGWIWLGLGLGLRAYALESLGKQFSPTIFVRPATQFVVKMPYAVIRHPAYLGAILFFCGQTVLLNGHWLVSTLVMSLVYLTRIHYEEQWLEKAYPSYEQYKNKTWKLIPFIL